MVSVKRRASFFFVKGATATSLFPFLEGFLSQVMQATTALGSIHPQGREMGICAGANVVMPNLSPQENRANYALYNNKLSSGAESAQMLEELKERMARIGYEVVTDRGDAPGKKCL